ncbi:MAG: DNA-binding protein, partial [Porticoccaceae bacterium]|nr:DNA-binding protein [Porticoccaceae bacterium]
MARAGVTYHDVAKAAEVIKNQRQEPTVDRVREQLGTGSKSTIAPLLKRWRSDNGEAADVSGLPNDLVEVVKSLYERVQQMGDHRIEQARDEFKASNDELRKELTEARNTIAQLTARQQDLNNQLSRVIEKKSQQDKSLEDARVGLAKAESQRDEALARTTELKESVGELKQENRDIRDHFEHYQQRTAEDRQQERDQFRIVNQGLNDQIQDLQHRLAQAELRASELFDVNAQLQRNAD